MLGYPEPRAGETLGEVEQRAIAEPEEMTGMVLFHRSDAASYVTSETYLVDGGQTVRELVPVETTVNPEEA